MTEERESLLAEIEKVERQLFTAESESTAWNRGKLKNHLNADLSKIMVASLEKQLADLKEKLKSLE